MNSEITEKRIKFWLEQADEDLDTAKSAFKEADAIIKQVAEYLYENFDIHEIYLFGSFVKGDFDNDSDIDMALYLRDYGQHTLKDFAKIQFYIQNNISSRIELHFFPDNIEPLTFPAHVRSIGKKVA